VPDLHDSALVLALADLDHPHTSRRREAAEQLSRALQCEPGAAGSPDAADVREALRRELMSAQPRRRWGAAFALAQADLVDEAVVAVATETLGSRDGDLSWAAHQLLCAAGARREAVAAKLRALVAEAGTVSRTLKMALFVLRDLGGEPASTFAPALDHEDPMVRIAALAGLARASRPGSTAIDRLAAMIDGDADARVARAAAAVAGPLARRYPAVRGALERAVATAHDPALSRAARRALTVCTQAVNPPHDVRPAAAEDTMEDLADKHCRPWPQGADPLTGAPLAALAARVPDWEVVDGHHLHRRFTFADFVSALAFVNRLGELAEAEQHHPDITLTWGRVDVEIHTHSAGGLTDNDFIWAARADRILEDSSK
jgi:4a-hydroxytetrahydrobiopterin dehydratase